MTDGGPNYDDSSRVALSCVWGQDRNIVIFFIIRIIEALEQYLSCDLQ